MKNSDSRGIWAWDIVKLITILSLVLYTALIFFKGWNEETNRLLIRLTARTSAFFFILAFAGNAFHKWQKKSFSWWVFINRKFFGITFAILHLIHLFLIILLQKYFHPVFEMAASSSLISGGLAYLFLVLMLMTSFSFFAKMISKTSWKRLHTVGGYWIWLIFMISYLKRVDAEIEFLPMIILFSSGLILRFWKIRPFIP